MTTSVASSAGDKVFNNDVKRASVADVTVSFMNAMKLGRRGTGIRTSESGTDVESVEELQSVNLATRRASSGASKSSSNMLRRRSTLRGVAQSITGLLRLRRLTITKSEPVKPKIAYENTYKMTPDLGEHIAPSKIEQLAEKILREEIADKKYNSYTAGRLTCTISERIKAQVKNMEFPRYRIICQVVVAEVKDQGLEAASRCLWNARSDNYTTVTYTNDSMCATAMIYGVYLE